MIFLLMILVVVGSVRGGKGGRFKQILGWHNWWSVNEFKRLHLRETWDILRQKLTNQYVSGCSFEQVENHKSHHVPWWFWNLSWFVNHSTTNALTRNLTYYPIHPNTFWEGIWIPIHTSCGSVFRGSKLTLNLTRPGMTRGWATGCLGLGYHEASC